MSSTLRRTNWLKQNYDKLLLVVVLLLLLCSALFLVWQVQQKRSEQSDQVRASAPFIKAASISTTNWEQPLNVISRTNLMEVGRNIMGSEERVRCVSAKCGKPIPFDAAICPFCGAKQPEVEDPLTKSTAHDGIPDVWKKKYGFDILDETVANRDDDKDGFTNLEEFRAGTDPRDPKSHPDISSKLRVWHIGVHPFKLRFMTYMPTPSGVSTNYQLNLRTGRTLFLKLGEVAEDYRLLAHEPTAADGDVLVLEKGAEKLRLVKGHDLQQSEMTADLIFMLDRKRFNGKVKDSTIKIRDLEYKIIDIRLDGVILHESLSGKDIQVPLVTDAERNDVRGDTAPRGVAHDK